LGQALGSRCSWQLFGACGLRRRLHHKSAAFRALDVSRLTLPACDASTRRRSLQHKSAKDSGAVSVSCWAECCSPKYTERPRKDATEVGVDVVALAGGGCTGERLR
jgi:hypothetical protein